MAVEIMCLQIGDVLNCLHAWCPLLYHCCTRKHEEDLFYFKLSCVQPPESSHRGNNLRGKFSCLRPSTGRAAELLDTHSSFRVMCCPGEAES